MTAQQAKEQTSGMRAWEIHRGSTLGCDGGMRGALDGVDPAASVNAAAGGVRVRRTSGEFRHVQILKRGLRICPY